jgi:ribonuclease T2
VVFAEQGKSREYFFLKIAAAVFALALSGQAFAQANVCRIPARLDLPEVRKPYDEPSRSVPVTGYTLALSWSPEFCRSRGDDVQCDPANGRFGFIIHGLWPEGEGREAPLWCSAAPIPRQVVRDQFCAMPSPRLIAHEWAKHGSCATRNPGQYFAASRKLFGAIRFPDMDTLSRQSLSVGDFKRMLVAYNPTIPASAINIEASGGWLREVRLCLTAKLLPEPCPRSRARGARDTGKLRIWRR